MQWSKTGQWTVLHIWARTCYPITLEALKISQLYQPQFFWVIGTFKNQDRRDVWFTSSLSTMYPEWRLNHSSLLWNMIGGSRPALNPEYSRCSRSEASSKKNLTGCESQLRWFTGLKSLNTRVWISNHPAQFPFWKPVQFMPCKLPIAQRNINHHPTIASVLPSLWKSRETFA